LLLLGGKRIFMHLGAAELVSFEFILLASGKVKDKTEINNRGERATADEMGASQWRHFMWNMCIGI